MLLTGTLRQRDWETKEGEKRTTMEVDVTEIGPSLRWATAKISKATRNGDSDQWETNATNGDNPPPDEPPF